MKLLLLSLILFSCSVAKHSVSMRVVRIDTVKGVYKISMRHMNNWYYTSCSCVLPDSVKVGAIVNVKVIK